MIWAFRTKDDELVYVEAAESGTEDGGRRPAAKGKSRGVIVEARQGLEEALVPLRAVANSLAEQASKFVRKPSEVEVKLALRIEGEVGLIVAKSKGEAGIEVTLRWGNQE